MVLDHNENSKEARGNPVSQRISRHGPAVLQGRFNAWQQACSAASLVLVSIVAIVIIAIAASGALMMRFRKRWLAKINIAFTNRITSLFAGWLPWFGILTHVGRKSGKVYRTPINVFRAPTGFVIAKTYSSQSEWVRNVLPAGGRELRTRGKKYQLSDPRVAHDATRRLLPIPVRSVKARLSGNAVLPVQAGSHNRLGHS